jgi:hypothetical protein
MEITWEIQVLTSVTYDYINSPTNYIREGKESGNEPTGHLMQLEIDQ